MDINLKSTVSLAGDGMAASCETKVLDTTVAQEMVYVDGTLYVSALGVNVKGPATEAEARKALEAMQVRIPDDNLGAFSQKTLLRSEDGSCRVILSEPTVDLLSLLNFSHLIAQEDGTEDAPAEGEEAVLPEEESLRFTKISDVYLSLAFSAEGTLTGMELGGDVTCLQNGVESLMTLKVTYKILSTDPAQVQVAPPADGDSYADAEDSADPEGGENSEENAG